jgi:hypothetical protein
MTNKTNKTFLKLFVTVSLACAAALLAPQASKAVDMVVTGRTLSEYHKSATLNWTNGATINDVVVTSTNGNIVPIPPDVDVALWVYTQGSGTGTSNTWYGLNFGWAGTNAVTGIADDLTTNLAFTTGYPLSVTNQCNGANQVVSYFFISRTNLYGVTALRWDQWGSSQPNAVSGHILLKYLSPSQVK